MTQLARTMRQRFGWYMRNSLSPAFWAVGFYRVAHGLYRCQAPLIPDVIDGLSRLITGVEIHHRAEIGPGLVIFHGSGVVIGSGVRMGANCVVFQGVTMGVRRPRQYDDLYPTVGNGVHIYAGAVLVGPITVGDNVTIGANAVVGEDVPPGAIVTAPRAEIRVRAPRTQGPQGNGAATA